MYNKDFSNIGEEIRRTVEEAMNSMDYGQLNQKINQSVNMAMDEARRRFGQSVSGRQTVHVEPPHMDSPHVKQPNAYKKQTRSTVKRTMPKAAMDATRFKEKGKLSGVLLTIIGAIGTTGMLPFTIGTGIMSFLEKIPVEKAAGLILFITCMIMTSLFLVCLVQGIRLLRRASIFKQYVMILGGREFCSIEELASRTEQSEKKIRKRIKAMIKNKMFVHGFLDEKETCLIVTPEALKLYRQAQTARKMMEEEEKLRQEQAKVPKSAVDEMIEKGDYYIRAIREANDAIPGEVISAKLDRLELVVRKIFESVKKHPEQMSEMDRFMGYYLPTTEKLVNAYKEFDALPIKGENVTNSMKEIENTLDTISHAFEQLLDDLFMDAAFDISSDISVLQTMLAREGYKKKDFE